MFILAIVFNLGHKRIQNIEGFNRRNAIDVDVA